MYTSQLGAGLGLVEETRTLLEIKSLFDPSKDIYRTIEKVIIYGAAQEQRLKAEISEYIVTESIEEQLETLLSGMQAAMDMGDENEVGSGSQIFMALARARLPNISAWRWTAASKSMASPFSSTCRIGYTSLRPELFSGLSRSDSPQPC